MKRALVEFGYLWATRKSSGFPWPFTRGLGWPDTLWKLVFGQTIYSVQPTWKQALMIPLRPYRYARMVRQIARTRSTFYSPAMYDDVP